MPENICLAVDSACDLPASIYKENNIQILPISLLLNGTRLVDDRDPDKMTQFYLGEMGKKSFDAETEPFTVEEMSRLLETRLALEYDEVLAITINSARSEIYKNVRDAVFVSQPKFKELRAAAGKSPHFKIRVFDSKTLFTGQGVMVYEALRLLNEMKMGPSDIITRLTPLQNKIRALVLPQDLYHLKNRASTKGDKSVSWLSYQMGSMLNVKPIIQSYRGDTAPLDKAMGFDNGLSKVFEYARNAIDNKLSVNAVVMSYAGDLRDIIKNKKYNDFIAFAKSAGVKTLLSVMSTTAAVNVGPGTFSLAYAEA